MLHFFFVGAAHFNHGAIVENQVEFTIHVGTYLHHTIKINNGAAMHTLKVSWVQLRLKIFHGNAHDVRLVICMDAHVVACGIYPIDINSGNECRLPAILDSNTIRIGFGAGILLDELGN